MTLCIGLLFGGVVSFERGTPVRAWCGHVLYVPSWYKEGALGAQGAMRNRKRGW
jgi:hypothetical protein